MKFFVKTKDKRDGRPNLAVWSASYASAKPLAHGGVSYHPTFTGNYYLHVFSLIHPVDEFFFKEMRMWGQSKISS